jgi:hypothetical protein
MLEHFIKRFENKDVSNFLYPIMIFLSGWYIIPNFIRLSTIWDWQPMMIVYSIIWMLLPLSLCFLLFKGVKLCLRWSYLFIVGILFIIIFSCFAVISIFKVDIGLMNLFFSGWWDHIFFPIVFGLLFLCDLRLFPKRFWALLLPFAFFNLVPNLNILSNILFDSWIIFVASGEGPPGFFSFFSVNNWFEYSRIINEPWFLWSFGTYVREQFTFFTIIPISIIYYFFKKIE